MLNQVVLVGRLVKDIEVKELEEGKKVGYITLAVNRAFKNEDGIYETDFVDCVLWDNVAQNVSEYCKKGDVIGIKGRIQVRYTGEEEVKTKVTEIVAEKVTFLSSNMNTKDNPSNVG